MHAQEMHAKISATTNAALKEASNAITAVCRHAFMIQTDACCGVLFRRAHQAKYARKME